MIRSVLPLLTSGALLFKSKQVAENADAVTREAVCILRPEQNQTAKGVVKFKQTQLNAPTNIQGNFTGLEPNTTHGFHIHVYGNLQNGCVTAGPHFNPFNQTHGGPSSEIRHVGDLGNVVADATGSSKYELNDSQVQLYGQHSVVGRACVLHQKEDDLGKGGNAESLKTGNAGARIACGVIGIGNY